MKILRIHCNSKKSREDSRIEKSRKIKEKHTTSIINKENLRNSKKIKAYQLKNQNSSKTLHSKKSIENQRKANNTKLLINQRKSMGTTENIQNLRTAKEMNKKTRSTKIINKIENTSERTYENQLS